MTSPNRVATLVLDGGLIGHGDHRGAGAGANLQEPQAHGRGGPGRGPDRPRRGNRRLPRAERRREDHDPAHADHAAQAHRGDGHGGGRRPAGEPARRAQEDRLRAAGHRRDDGRDRPVLPGHRGTAGPGRAVPHRRRRGAAAGGAAGRAARADRARAAAGQDAVRRAAAAAGDRARAGAPAAAGLPGRADHRPGPAEPQQPVGAHRQPAVRSGHHGLPHHALPGGSGRPVRPGVHHRPRGDRGRGHARRAQAAHLRRRGDAAGGRRGSRDRRRPEAARRPGRGPRGQRGRRHAQADRGARRAGAARAAPGARRGRRHAGVDQPVPADPGRRVPHPDRALAARRPGDPRGRTRGLWGPGRATISRQARSSPHELHPRYDAGLPPPGAAGAAPAGLGHHRPDPADPVPGAVRPAAERPARARRWAGAATRTGSSCPAC